MTSMGIMEKKGNWHQLVSIDVNWRQLAPIGNSGNWRQLIIIYRYVNDMNMLCALTQNRVQRTNHSRSSLTSANVIYKPVLVNVNNNSESNVILGTANKEWSTKYPHPWIITWQWNYECSCDSDIIDWYGSCAIIVAISLMFFGTSIDINMAGPDWIYRRADLTDCQRPRASTSSMDQPRTWW